MFLLFHVSVLRSPGFYINLSYVCVVTYRPNRVQSNLVLRQILAISWDIYLFFFLFFLFDNSKLNDNCHQKKYSFYFMITMKCFHENRIDTYCLTSLPKMKVNTVFCKNLNSKPKSWFRSNFIEMSNNEWY